MLVTIQSAVRFILEHADQYEWSIQGLGMLRLYLSKSKQTRLHVWSPSSAVPGVSVLHNHPWDFQSTVVCGRIRNLIYKVSDSGYAYAMQDVICGPDGGRVGDLQYKYMRLDREEIWLPGDTYAMSRQTFHVSRPDEGTVTVCQRLNAGERATVAWPQAEKFVSAEPRPATREEITKMVANALALPGDLYE